MTHPRISLALDGRLFDLPERVVVFGARAGDDLSDLAGAADLQVVTGIKPDVDAFAANGVTAGPDVPASADLALVFLPRSKEQARGMIAQAASIAPVVAVDGMKTDGVDSLMKAARAKSDLTGPVNKAHGKLFVMRNADLSDWAMPDAPCDVGDGFVTVPGVFSADGVDPASALLAASLPVKLGGRLADFGAGWGYLSRYILTRDTVKSLHLVESDHNALICARQNVTDPRARFHWADATTWRADGALDGIIMNPPFHTTRTADPELGRAFIANAAANLAPSGRLWMVANRHLPYETALAEHFAQVEEFGGDARFKLIAASRPSRKRG